MKSEFFARRKFFDAYGALLNQQAAGAPPLGVRLSCPCCGFPMLGASAAYEICRLCSWEDDGQDTPNADEACGGPNNGYSLVEARDNFDRNLSMYPPAQDTRIGGPDTQRERVIKGEIISAFERMMDDPSPEELTALWLSVYENEQALYQELSEESVVLFLRPRHVPIAVQPYERAPPNSVESAYGTGTIRGML